MAWDTVEIGSFLTERKDRFEPDIANSMGLKRIEKIDFSGNIHVVDHKPTRTGMILVNQGDLVISGINAEKGAISIYDGIEDVIATIHYSSYKYDSKKINIDYFKWFLKSQIFKKMLKDQVRSGIKTEIKPKKFLPLKIQLPEIDIQKSILNKLNEMSDEFQKIDYINLENGELVNQLRQAILQEAVQGKLVPQDPNDEPARELLKRIKAEKESMVADKKISKEKPLPPISENEISYESPNGWTWVRLNNLLEPYRGITYGIVKLGNEPKDGIPTLRTSDVKFRYVNIRGVRLVSNKVSEKYKRTILCGGEILINIRGTLGGCAVVSRELIGYNISREVGLIPIHESINKSYILNVLSSPYFNDSIYKHLRGIAYKGLNLNILRNLLIPLPSLAEQKRIVAKVYELMSLCAQLEEQIKESKDNSDMLIQAVLKEAFEA